MRKNVGKEIMRYADIVKVLLMVIPGLIAFALFSIGFSGLVIDGSFASFLIFTIVAIVLFVVSNYFANILTMVLYGFGIIVDKTEHSPAIISPADNQEPSASHIQDKPQPLAVWSCAHCGTQNPLGQTRCSNCGKS